MTLHGPIYGLQSRHVATTYPLMSRKPDGTHLEDWITPLTARGRWGRVSSENKSFVDCDLIYDVAPAFSAEFGMELSAVREGSDPPDVVAIHEGRETSIELVELLKQTVRQKRAVGQQVTFDEQLWSREEFIAAVNALLDKKEATYQRRKDRFTTDILLIHSCEIWLDAIAVNQWLAAETFDPRPTIRSAYFTQERLPNYNKPHWPLHRLY
jgi:hypothetical protein